MNTMDWDEFERRGEERRAQRPEPSDVVSIVLGVILFCLVCFWITWGLLA